MSYAGSFSASKDSGPDMSDGELTPPPPPSMTELDPPLLQIIDEDSLDIVLNPLSGEATMSGISRRAAHKRLQVLGQDLIRFAALRYLWDKYPMDSGAFLQTKRDTFCRPHQFAIFAKLYRLTINVQDAEYAGPDIEKTYAAIFEAYVGAATIEMSIDRVYDWVYRICKSYGEETPLPSEGSTMPLAGPAYPAPTGPVPPLQSSTPFPPPTALAQMGYTFPANGGPPSSSQFSQPPPWRQPPLPGQSGVKLDPNVKQEAQEYHPSMPLLPPDQRPLARQPMPPPQMPWAGPPGTPQQQQPYFQQAAYRQTPVFSAIQSKVSGSLAAFRQKASQLRKEVSFTETSIGPDHQKQWTCALLVDHIEVGVGTASSKQVAKDLAAQQALIRLNWL